jgi:hypothetical protein
MVILRITECFASSSVSERELFSLLEHCTNYSLLECRGKDRLMLLQVHRVLVLDHLDESSNPIRILEQVLGFQDDIQLLVTVDKNRSFATFDQLDLIPSCHFLWGHKNQQTSAHASVSPNITDSVDQTVAFLKHQLWPLRTVS